MDRRKEPKKPFTVFLTEGEKYQLGIISKSRGRTMSETIITLIVEDFEDFENNSIVCEDQDIL
jgi:hypothetical protein